MSAQRHVLLAALLLPALATAAEDRLPGPWLVQAGWSPFFPGVSDVVGNRGLMLGAAWSDPVFGLFGQGGAEIQYRSAHRASGRIDDLSAAYVERIPWQGNVYGGGGIGLWGSRLDDRTEAGEGVHLLITPGIKGLVGYQFAPPTPDMRLALEFAVLLIAPAHGFATGGAPIAEVAGF